MKPTSKKFSVNFTDMLHSLLIAAASGAIDAIKMAFSTGAIDWPTIASFSGAAGLAYILKAFITPAMVKTDNPADPTPPPSAAASIILLFCLFASSCTVVKPEVDTTTRDSLSVKHDTIRINVPGATVQAGFNCDSLIQAWTVKIDKYKEDSTTAANAHQPLPPKPVTDTIYKTDPNTRAQLKYYMDKSGQIDIDCQAKDELIKAMQNDTNRYKTVNTVTKIPVYTNNVPWWSWLIIGAMGVIIVALLVFLIIK